MEAILSVLLLSHRYNTPIIQHTISRLDYVFCFWFIINAVQNDSVQKSQTGALASGLELKLGITPYINTIQSIEVAWSLIIDFDLLLNTHV